MLQMLKQDIVRSPVTQKIIQMATLQLTYSLAVTPFFATFSTCPFATRANYEAEWRFAQF